MRIDSHHHFWLYKPDEYPWISDSMSMLHRDFTPADLSSTLKLTGIDRVVSIQARQTVEETRWLIQLAEENEFIRGVVGWVPLAEERVSQVLDGFVDSPWLKGVRHVVQNEPDDRFILSDEFNRGVARLMDYNLVYDILIFARQLSPTIEFVDRHPNQPFVLDHIAKPTISSTEIDENWQLNIRELSHRENVTCKFSGLVTEVRDDEWSVDVLRPYCDTVVEAFGPERLMYGSD